MNFNEYQQGALSTFRKMPESDAKMYCAFKLCEEAAEVGSPIVKNIVHGKELDPQEVKMELGDALFYIAVQAHLHGFTLEEVAEANSQKLKDRHGSAGYRQSYYIEKSETSATQSQEHAI